MQVLRFASLILTAIGLSMGAAHVLEMPPRMKYDGELYMAVTRTMYRLFAIVGGIVQIGSILAVGALCWRSRGHRSFTPALLALLALISSMILWAAIVQPVNVEWAHVLQTDPASAPTVYLQLRNRWESGHIIAAAAWFAGFVSLVISILSRPTGEGTAPRERVARESH